jgi:NAD(P)-dependent dehydrogenase (short-subunit alcohol dehydrogenase family)
MNITKNIVILGVTSDIGTALCVDWLAKGWEISGTYRNMSSTVKALSSDLKVLVECDLKSNISVDAASASIAKVTEGWDVLVLGPGLQEPTELFKNCNFDEWEMSVTVNFTSQLRFLHGLLSKRKTPSLNGPTVIFFAGGGVNSAPTHYSAYTVSKIALIKMVELLASEIPEVKFIIIGPGWVKTKIHDSILKAGNRAGISYERTLQTFNNGDFTPMSDVVECCNILIKSSRESLTGRNFSVVYDNWREPNFVNMLEKNKSIYKLRRQEK